MKDKFPKLTRYYLIIFLSVLQTFEIIGLTSLFELCEIQRI